MTLTVLQVKNVKPGDKLSDGGGLRLDADRSGNASWVFRFKSPLTGRERYMGLGPLGDVSLSKAREDAQAARAAIREGKDPIEERNRKRLGANEGRQGHQLRGLCQGLHHHAQARLEEQQARATVGEHAQDLRLPSIRCQGDEGHQH
jgi:hypothetical protein